MNAAVHAQIHQGKSTCSHPAVFLFHFLVNGICPGSADNFDHSFIFCAAALLQTVFIFAQCTA